MDRLLYNKSASSPPTPAASSAGASSPAIPANMASVDWCGLEKGRKGSSLSRSGAQLPWAAASTSTAGGSTPSSSQPACRPWDRGDLLKRLATYKSSSWFGKPKVAGPLACARRGWVNVDVNLIACEACGARLNFSTPSSWSPSQVEIAAEAFGEQLDSGHKAVCSWKGNPCAESLAQFPPTSISALIGGYDDRCDALLQLSALPLISGSSIDQMKLTRGPQIDRLLGQPPPLMGRRIDGRLEDGTGTDCSRGGSMHATNISYYQAQRLISLCGWEPRLLPYIVDEEEHSAYSARNANSVDRCEGSHRICDPGPSVLLHSRTGRLEKKASGHSVMMVPESKCDPASAVLDCGLCGASVGLGNFVTVARPSPLMGSILAETPEPQQKYVAATMHGVSAASGVDGWGAVELPMKEKQDHREEAGDATITGERKSSSHGGTLDLNLTIAGGPTPTLLGSLFVTPQATDLGIESQPADGQPEGSEMGGPVASYESFGPGAGEHRLDEGGSTVDRPQSKMHHGERIEGSVVDLEGDEVDDGEIGRGRFYVGESSKRKRTGESSAGDQFSYGLAMTDPGCSNLVVTEGDTDLDWNDKNKRNRRDLILQDLYDQRMFPVQPARDSVYASSVIAVDTSYSKQENSMESVENYPQDSDAHGTAISLEKSEREDLEELNMFEQAQQSTCHEVDIGGLDEGLVEPGISTSDEGGGDLVIENDVAVGVGHGFSMGMSGGSVQMGASHEAEIHGADFSVHRTESVAGDAELVTEVTENGRQTSESVLDRALIGEFVPDGPERTEAPEILVDSHEAVPSLSVAKRFSSGRYDDSAQGESWESEGKGALGDHVTDTNQAVVQGSEENYCTEATVIEREIQGAHSTATGEGRAMGDRRLRQQGGEEFDPIQHHHHCCPWVNGYVAAAGTGDMGIAAALCGWQLTIDAFQFQEQAPAAPMESESAASMHKGDPITVSKWGTSTQPRNHKGN